MRYALALLLAWLVLATVAGSLTMATWADVPVTIPTEGLAP